MRLVRRLIDGASCLLGAAKRRQRVKIPAGIDSVRINLGCGLAVAQGWFNVDGSLNALIAGLPGFLHGVIYRMTGANRYYSKAEYCQLLANHQFVHHDLAYGIPFDDESVDFVYSSHFLEHLYRADAQRILSESYRVLRLGGTIRVSVPDLEYAVSLYHAGRRHEMLSNYFFVEDDASHYARHKYMYDFVLLSEALSTAGFSNIRRCEFQKGATPDLQKLDNRPEESLFVEATR